MSRIKELIEILNKATKEYDEGHPSMSDKEWDDLYFELKELEKETGIIYPNSPTQSIHFEEVSALNKVKHNHPMLSLDKTKNSDDIASFVKGHAWLGMFKMDGLTVSLTYENGKLVRAETRGNGVEGEDVTHNAFVIKSIPKTIPTKDIGSHIYDIADKVVIDGEVICTFQDFEPFENEYKNPRNFASGSIRLLDSKECASRNLTFVAWDLIEGIDEDFFFWRLEKLDDWGFITVPRVGDAETVDDAIDILDRMEEHKYYPIDGYVFKFESKKFGESLGRTEHHFKNGIAFKFYDEEYETELIDIEWSMGRTGQITPVAIFKEININGSIVSRASLHNYSMLKEILGRYPDKDQKIWVIKSNEIIPQITRAIKNDIPHDHILNNGVCTYCPVCGKPTDIHTSDTGVETIYCGNPSCEGKLQNRIDHYCGKKGLDIKGISKATIEKLIEWGWINGLRDIYKLDGHRAEWISKEGFGTASVEKILNAINASKSGALLHNFISALGIPLVGRTVSKEIVKYYPTWEEFRAAVGGDWTEFEGFGPEISRAINNFDYAEADKIAEIIDFKIDEVIEVAQSEGVKGKTFVITGKLSRKRDDIKAEIEAHGGKVTGSVSSKTDYLVCNDKNSTTGKSADAKKLGIPVITEEELNELY
jgi:DNA ligase (NAD+)